MYTRHVYVPCQIFCFISSLDLFDTVLIVADERLQRADIEFDPVGAEQVLENTLKGI